ncbi:MAG: NADH-quinone oxidoreductase subunit L [Actinomycetota bacterium]
MIFAGFSPGLAPYIILFPLIGSIVLLLAGKRLGRLSGPLATAAVGLSFLAGVVQFLRVVGISAGHGEGNTREATYRWFEWIAAGDFRFSADLLVDQLSMLMVLVVTGVGTLIHVYSIGYMHGDPRYPRYFAYLNLFAASMLLLVLADNLLLMFVGWEGVGLCSYLLIGFWFERDVAANAAKKAFIVNRIGDFSFMLGIFLLAGTVGSLAFGEINALARGGMSAGIATIAALLLFGGATGKSAQIPLYIWLPDAMEGPTPVSALIHAATMVTAGVYMVARLSPLFEASGDALMVVAWIGAITALWAALMACAEYDIKKILAYSTISQLGYMFLAHGVGAYSAGMFHLVTHAFFKALMFLGAGAVMHGLAGETDIRKMSGLRKQMPVTGWTFAAGWLAICGIVPFSGFFSKDAILAGAWAQGEYVLWTIGVGTALLTAFYMSRLYFRVFEGPVRTPQGTHAHDAGGTMKAALIPLAATAVIGGIINLPGPITLEHFLEPVVGESELPTGIVPWLLGAAALLVAVAGIAVARSLYLLPGAEERRAHVQRPIAPLVAGARNKFYVDVVYGRALVLPGKAFAAFCADFFDRKVIDGAVNGSAWLVGWLSQGLRRVQTGYVRNYAAVFLLGVVVVFSLLILRVGIS